MNKPLTYERVYLEMLFRAYPYLKKRAGENPEPALVKLVEQIETLQKTENGVHS